MGKNINQINDTKHEKKKIDWNSLSIILVSLLILSLVISILVIRHNNQVLNDWRNLYLESNQGLINETEKNDELNKQIEEKNSEIEKIFSELGETSEKLLIESRITSQIDCRNLRPQIDLKNFDFSYSGNTALHRELKKFVESLGETITTSSWNPIWNNVDVAMHKITVKGNIRFYFITFFNDNEFPELKNSIFWLDKECFLDYPGLK
jgi:hypothetical protein